MVLTDLVAQFVTHMAQTDKLARITQGDYRRRIKRLIVYLGQGATVDVLTVTMARQHCRELATQYPSTVRPQVAACRAFCAWLIEEGWMTSNPFARIPLPKVKPVVRQPVPDKIIRKLLDTTDKLKRSAHYRARAKAVLCVLSYAALRRGELLNLRVADVDFNRDCITVRNGKGGKLRNVYPCTECIEALRDYYALRPISLSDKFFVCNRRRAMALAGLGRIIDECKTAAQITTRITPHMFRHSSATRDADRGVPLPIIQAKLGHKRIETTAIYIHANERSARQWKESNSIGKEGTTEKRKAAVPVTAGRRRIVIRRSSKP